MRLLLCVLALATVVLSSHAHAGTRTFTGVAPAATTRSTNIAGPANAQQSTFTSYALNTWRYNLYTFKVDQTGTYTATSSTGPNAVNTTWIVNGVFAPDIVAPTTPLGDFIVAVLSQSGPPAPFTGTFTGFNLTAGNTYSVLVAYNSNSVAGVDNNTFVITGPGSIADCGGGACLAAAPVPTTSEWALLLIGLLLAAGAAVVLQRRVRTLV